MSAINSAVQADDGDKCCANCGIKEIDDITLKSCAKCDLVEYCSDECQQQHEEQHAAECQLRAAELRDELLFRQPESNFLGDCPICCLPLPLDADKSSTFECCCKIICNACVYANCSRERKNKIEHRCLFCRKLVFGDWKTNDALLKRAECNDTNALSRLGHNHLDAGEYDSAFEYLSRAAALGDADAHHLLSCMYREGQGVGKDKKLEVFHLETAAIGGQLLSRVRLGLYELHNGRLDRAIKHLIIAANHGHDKSLQSLKALYLNGHVSKDDYASALRGHQAAVDATKSPQRDEADRLDQQLFPKSRKPK